MAKQSINVGTAANDKKGDSLRAAFQKVNANFTELYTQLGLTDPTLNLGAFTFTGSVMSTDDSSSIVIDQATTVTSNLTVGGDILPQTANGGDLGSLARPFRSLYVSNNTIYFGGTPLSLDANNNLTVNGSPVTGDGNSFDQDLNTDDSVTFNSVGATTVNVSQINGTNPGDELVIQANNHNWNFGADGLLTLPNGQSIGSGSLDGIKMTTDRGTVLFGNSPECVPTLLTHFHIMKDDPANVDLFLGDDNNYVKLPGSGETAYGVEIGTNVGSAYTWRFGTDGDLTLPEGGDILDSNGDSVLGGGSYTPDDSANWNDPTVNTVAAALDELAAKVAALENFEIDGGNAYTPAAGELIIDGNGA
jgi:hypothetical protein